MCDEGCVSTFCVHTWTPVDAFSAYTFERPSPKYNGVDAPAGAPSTIAVRTPAFALKVQIAQPVLPSSEYTVPSWLPTNTRPPAIVGCARAVLAPGNPSAHFNLSLGVFSGVRPACVAGWKRAFELSGPHPVHPAPCAGSNGAGLAQRPAFA